MKSIQAFVGVVLAMATVMVHATTPTVGELIDAEATRTLHQMTESDKGSGASAGNGGAAGGLTAPGIAPTAPLPTVAAGEGTKPKHPDGLFARFGVLPNLSGYLMWNDVVHQVSVGRKVKGWTVIAINADGVDLRSPKGGVKHFDSLVDAGLEADADATPQQSQNRASANIGMPQAPMPPGVAPMMPSFRASTVGGR